MKKVTTAALVGTAGAALLLGGAGTLAYWTDTATGATNTVQTGSLELGSIDEGRWFLSQRADDMPEGTAQADTRRRPMTRTTTIVPGDVLAQTVNVPVTLVGTNNKAELTVALPETVQVAGEDVALSDLGWEFDIQVAGGDGNSAVFTPGTLPTGGLVEVEVEMTFPWGEAGEFNDVQDVTGSFALDYDLVQIPVTS